MVTREKAKYELVQDVTKGDLVSAYVVAPFDKGLEVLQEGDYRLISSQENSRLRIQEGYQAYISQMGNWVSEDAIYVPNKGKFLTKVSHIARNAREATQAHRNGEDFYLNENQVEECLADCVELTSESVPTNRFGENEITIYAFGEHTEDYGKLLREYGIKEMPVWLAGIRDKPFARKVWFVRLGDNYRSDLHCGIRVLYGDDDRVRGVRHNSGEAANFCEHSDEEKRAGIREAQKISAGEKTVPYTRKNINSYLDIVHGVRKGNLPNSKLEELIEFLEKLKQ
ncbi:hypothetical protein J4221_07065 [Candidatus Pacearchaeota archaeon]|nr:hypothetical protein [Candidatus Pacearchaeota archaeon]